MKKTYLLDGLDCASCAIKIEKAINKLDGVNHATLSFATTKLIMDIDENVIEHVEQLINETINKYEPQVQMKKR